MATAQEMAQDLIALRLQIRSLRDAETSLCDELAAEMPDRRLEVDGLGVFERSRKQKRTEWQSDDLVQTLTGKIRNREIAPVVDEETGEIMEDDVALTARVLTTAARPDWRLTPLRELAIPIDEYSKQTYEPGFSIRYTGPALDRGIK